MMSKSGAAADEAFRRSSGPSQRSRGSRLRAADNKTVMFFDRPSVLEQDGLRADRHFAPADLYIGPVKRIVVCVLRISRVLDRGTHAAIATLGSVPYCLRHMSPRPREMTGPGGAGYGARAVHGGAYHPFVDLLVSDPCFEQGSGSISMVRVRICQPHGPILVVVVLIPEDSLHSG